MQLGTVWVHLDTPRVHLSASSVHLNTARVHLGNLWSNYFSRHRGDHRISQNIYLGIPKNMKSRRNHVLMDIHITLRVGI